MRTFFLLAVATMFASCSTTTIYMTRHAERQVSADGIVTSASDPDLTPAGRMRADALRDSLHNKHIAVAFATQYKRTFQTAEPTAIDQHISLRRYVADDSNQFIDSLIKAKKQKLFSCWPQHYGASYASPYWPAPNYGKNCGG